MPSFAGPKQSQVFTARLHLLTVLLPVPGSRCIRQNGTNNQCITFLRAGPAWSMGKFGGVLTDYSKPQSERPASYCLNCWSSTLGAMSLSSYSTLDCL